MSEASGTGGGRTAAEQDADGSGPRSGSGERTSAEERTSGGGDAGTGADAGAGTGEEAGGSAGSDGRSGADSGAGPGDRPGGPPRRPLRGARVVAEGLGLRGARGEVFSGVTLDAPPGSLIAVEGPSGSGRTCLLLTLTGRMKATSGHAAVGGHPLPKQLSAVRALSALGPVPGVTDLEPSLSVAEQLRERVLLQRRFGGSLRALFRPREERAAAARERIDAALDAAGLDLDALPKGRRTRVSDLERIETLRLSLALALLGEPELVAVDDMDLKLSDAGRAEAWSLLRSLAEEGMTVLAVCSQAPEDALVVRTGGTDRADGPDGEGRSREGRSAGKSPGKAAGKSPGKAAERNEREGQDALA